MFILQDTLVGVRLKINFTCLHMDSMFVRGTTNNGYLGSSINWNTVYWGETSKPCSSEFRLYSYKKLTINMTYQ